MKVLVLNGSPRRNGKISRLVRMIADGAAKNGADGTSAGSTAVEVTSVDVCDLQFRSCTGCMACRKSGNCVLPHDDAHDVAQKIMQCDVLVAGSPVYWANMSGDMKRLFDRMVGIMMGESKLGMPVPLLKGKKAVIVTACTTPFPFNVLAGQSTKAVHALKEILGYAGFRIKAVLVLPGTKGMKDIPVRVQRRASRIGAGLV